MSSPLDIQRALKARGYDPGPIDGVRGRRTIAAVKAFQRDGKLVVDGIAGPETVAALNAAPGKGGPGRTAAPIVTTPAKPVWFVEAERLKGIHEIAGARSNPTIMGWAKTLSSWVASVYRNDDTPWCGLFVGHVVAVSLPEEPLPGNPLSALAWAGFGRKLSEPAIGAVCVFTRKGGGHVGFYAGEDGNAIQVLGGNQSNTVRIAPVPKSRLVGFRWPSTAPAPAGGRVARASVGALSQNEA